MINSCKMSNILKTLTKRNISQVMIILS